MGPVADAELVATALEMGVARRRPGDGLIHHSDRGSQPRINRSSQQRVLSDCTDGE